MISLMGASRDNMTLHDALSGYACALSGYASKHSDALEDHPVGLLYSPRECVFVTVDTKGVLHFAPDRDCIDEKSVFEARIFCTSAELRWLHRADGVGTGVVLTEYEDLLTPLLAVERSQPWASLAPIMALEGNPVQYVLWGTGTGDNLGEGWSRLAKARIGKLDVPVKDVPERSHVMLYAQEYLTLETVHGNVEVAEERIVGLGVLDEHV